jgi:hypothetical protein
MGLKMFLGQTGGLEFMDDITLPKSVVILYYKRLSGRIYKCLPILEGKDLSGRIIYPPEIAKENFKKHASKLLIEIYGNATIFFSTEYALQVIGLLRGMLMDVNIEDKPEIRTLVFDCISLLHKAISQLEEGDGIGI